MQLLPRAYGYQGIRPFFYFYAHPCETTIATFGGLTHDKTESADTDTPARARRSPEDAGDTPTSTGTIAGKGQTRMPRMGVNAPVPVTGARSAG